jgi:hypothetical protein
MSAIRTLSPETATATVPGLELSGPRVLQLPGKEISRPVPFSDLIISSPPALVRVDHLTSGLACAFTTTIDNPFFRLPSAQDERNGALPAAFAVYGPYYVGMGMTPEEIAVDVAEQAAGYLDWLDADHGYDGYVGRVLSILRREDVAEHGLQAIEDRNALMDVHDFLAIFTQRLHHLGKLILMHGEPASPAHAYRTETHEKVDPYVHTVLYQEDHAGLTEQFKLPEFIRSEPADVAALGWDFFKSWRLRRGAEFAALAAQKVGNPIVRDALSEHYVPPYTRRTEYLQRSR